MFCPDCRNEIGSDGFCGVCGACGACGVCGACSAGAGTRPTIFGRGAPGQFCSNCGARSTGSAWSPCAICGAATPQGLAIFAGVMAALLALFGTALLLSIPRYSPPTPQPVYETVPVPVEQPTIVVRSSVFTPSQDRWEITAITQSPGGTAITRSVGAVVVSRGPQDNSAQAASGDNTPPVNEAAPAADEAPVQDAAPQDPQDDATPVVRTEVIAPSVQVSTYNQ